MTRTNAPEEYEKFAYPIELLTESQNLVVIPQEECEILLDSTPIGRVGFTSGGETLILPVNFTFVAGFVLFRSAPGSKMYAGLMNKPTSLEIDDWDAATRTGWSVLVKGRCDVVTDEWLTSMYDSLGVVPWADSIPRDNWLRIRASEITGRRIDRTTS